MKDRLGNKMGDNMGKRLNLWWENGKKYIRLASVNYKAISEYNEKILSALTLIGGLLTLIGGLLTLLPLLAAPFSKTKTKAVPVCMLTAALLFALFFLFKLPFMKNMLFSDCIFVFPSCFCLLSI